MTTLPVVSEVKPRRQCAKCPWKVGTDPRTVPGYDVEMHLALKRSSIAEPWEVTGDISPTATMACHETTSRHPLACVGWLANQLGPGGNNIALRLRAMDEPSLMAFELVGPQHARFEDTLPRPIVVTARRRRRVVDVDSLAPSGDVRAAARARHRAARPELERDAHRPRRAPRSATSCGTSGPGGPHREQAPLLCTHVPRAPLVRCAGRRACGRRACRDHPVGACPSGGGVCQRS